MNPKTPPKKPIDMRPQAILTRLYLIEELRRVGTVLLQAKKRGKLPIERRRDNHATLTA